MHCTHPQHSRPVSTPHTAPAQSHVIAVHTPLVRPPIHNERHQITATEQREASGDFVASFTELNRATHGDILGLLTRPKPAKGRNVELGDAHTRTCTVMHVMVRAQYQAHTQAHTGTHRHSRSHKATQPHNHITKNNTYGRPQQSSRRQSRVARGRAVDGRQPGRQRRISGTLRGIRHQRTAAVPCAWLVRGSQQSLLQTARSWTTLQRLRMPRWCSLNCSAELSLGDGR